MPSLELIDTHCHLDRRPLSDAVEAVLARAREAGVIQCVSVGTALASSRANIALAERFPHVAAAVGIHPHEADHASDEMVSALEALASHPRVVAIGEVGLDDSRQPASSAQQQRVFRACIAVAQRRQLPLLIHCRDAYELLLRLLEQEAPSTVRGVIHCASGPPEFIQGALSRGLHISFAGNVTFPNAQSLRALVPLVPDERLLLETDAPFLAPQPVRGLTNEPAYVAHTAAVLAQLRGTTADALGALTSRNARRLFGLPMVQWGARAIPLQTE